MSRSTNYTACTFPLMCRGCMAGPTSPAGISSFHVVVTANNLNSACSVAQLATRT